MLRNTGDEATVLIRNTPRGRYSVEFKMDGLSFDEVVAIGEKLEGVRVKYSRSFEEKVIE